MLFNIKAISFIFLYTLIFLFDATVYKYIWNVPDISRLSNTLILLLASLFSFFTIFILRYNIKIWLLFLIPALLIYLGYFANISRNVLVDIGLSSYYGLLITPAILLSIPGLYKTKFYSLEMGFKTYYWSILIMVILGLSDYLLILSGFLSPALIETSGGFFVSGNFSILLDLEDTIFNDTDYDVAFYAAILENGSLAMLTLPAIIYGIFYKKTFGSIILIISLYLADALGGYLSFALAALLLPIYFNKVNIIKSATSKIFFILFYFIIFFIVSFFIVDTLIGYWQSKFIGAQSGWVRVDNFLLFFQTLPQIITNNPLGFDLFLNIIDDSSTDFAGTNLGYSMATYLGGIPALTGYFIISITFLYSAIKSFFQRNLSKLHAVSSLSIIVLFPFIVQRAAIFETTILILCLSPFVIEFLSKEDKIID
tara:strand:- start:13218 stop:14495 length:1278 start_codon:yes stop_codon:yes gene_type:complete